MPVFLHRLSFRSASACVIVLDASAYAPFICPIAWSITFIVIFVNAEVDVIESIMSGALLYAYPSG